MGGVVKPIADGFTSVAELFDANESLSDVGGFESPPPPLGFKLRFNEADPVKPPPEPNKLLLDASPLKVGNAAAVAVAGAAAVVAAAGFGAVAAAVSVLAVEDSCNPPPPTLPNMGSFAAAESVLVVLCAAGVRLPPKLKLPVSPLAAVVVCGRAAVEGGANCCCCG